MSPYVLAWNSELSEMAAEAMKYDGRLARLPAKSRNKEAQVMNLLLARLESLINQRSLAVRITSPLNVLVLSCSCFA